MQMPPDAEMPSRRAAILTPVSEYVVWLDDYVGDIDADAKGDTAMFRISSRKFVDAGLKP
ncbi:hypothetical protein ABIF03_004127 [Bradyrhizobium elkanii]